MVGAEEALARLRDPDHDCKSELAEIQVNRPTNFPIFRPVSRESIYPRPAYASGQRKTQGRHSRVLLEGGGPPTVK